MTTRHGITDTQITELSVADPLLRGRVELTDGAYPRAKDEIAATEAFIEASGLSIGDRVTVRGPEQVYTLTGAVELPAELEARSPVRRARRGHRPVAEDLGRRQGAATPGEQPAVAGPGPARSGRDLAGRARRQ
ncbi:hypothetical protein SMICM17S_02709 [Streptomyces microflavus]